MALDQGRKQNGYREGQIAFDLLPSGYVMLAIRMLLPYMGVDEEARKTPKIEYLKRSFV